MEKLPQVQISFYISGNELNFNDITARLNITPTKTSGKKEFPANSIANPFWVLKTNKDSCVSVDLQFKKMLKLLANKEKIIVQICREYASEVNFLVNIWMESGNNPEMILTKETILFIASINAEVGFDLYVD